MDAEAILLLAAFCAGAVRFPWRMVHAPVIFVGLTVAIWLPSISSEQLARVMGQGVTLPWWLGLVVAVFWGVSTLAAYWTGRGVRDAVSGQGT
jgi:hypothetical protein